MNELTMAIRTHHNDDTASGTATRPAARLRILLVDDEPALLRVLRAALHRHDTTAVTSGEEAVELLAAQRFDVVVSDHDMAGMTGVDVLWYAACVYPDTRRIMFSGTSPESIEEHEHTGVIERFVAKPSFAALCHLIDEISAVAPPPP